MPAKTYETKNSVENTKNRTQTGHTLPVSGFKDTPDSSAVISFPSPPEHPERRDKRDKTTIRAGRDSQAYWKTKVKPRVVRGQPTPELYCRLFEGKREAWICCDSSNRGIAADKARNYYLRMKAIGLPALLAELRPDIRPDRVCTVGEYIDAARAYAQVKPRVFIQYERALRRLVAAVLKLPNPSARFYHKGSAVLEWRKRIDSVRLDRLSPAAIDAWRVAYVNEAPDALKRKARSVTAASYIRNAKGAFARKIVARVTVPNGTRPGVILPPVLPLAGVTAPATTRRFRPEVSALALYQAAMTDLAAEPDTLAAFLLLICGGLRRSEADLLPWAHVDLAAGKITVAATAYFSPKTEEGERVVKLPPPVVAFLAGRREAAPKAEFVLHGIAPRPDSKSVFYRATAWPRLTAWVTAKGVTARTPLHELRKHSGSLVYAVGGIEAARRHLGHRKVTTTSASYLDAAEVVADPTAG